MGDRCNRSVCQVSTPRLQVPEEGAVARAGEHPGFVTEPTGAEVRATAADAARQARGVLAALADPDDELTATAAMRHRIEGAAVALETVASGDPVASPTG